MIRILKLVNFKAAVKWKLSGNWPRGSSKKRLMCGMKHDGEKLRVMNWQIEYISTVKSNVGADKNSWWFVMLKKKKINDDDDVFSLIHGKGQKKSPYIVVQPL